MYIHKSLRSSWQACGRTPGWHWEGHNLLHDSTHKQYHLHDFPMICGTAYHYLLCDAKHELNHHHNFGMICGTGMPRPALRYC